MNQVPIGFPHLCLQTRASNLLLTIGVRPNGLGQSTLQLAKWGIAGSFRPIRARSGHALGHDRPGRVDCRVKIMPRSPGTALAHVIRYFGSFPTRFATAQAVPFPQWQRHNFVPKETTPCIFNAVFLSSFLASPHPLARKGFGRAYCISVEIKGVKQTRISAARTFSCLDSTLSTQIPVASLPCPLVHLLSREWPSS